MVDASAKDDLSNINTKKERVSRNAFAKFCTEKNKADRSKQDRFHGLQVHVLLAV